MIRIHKLRVRAAPFGRATLKVGMAGLLILVAGFFILISVADQPMDQQPAKTWMADETSYSVTNSSDILVVYIGAENCPYCVIFETTDLPIWIKSEAYKHVHYRELNFPRFQKTDEDTYWPEDLRWIREKAYVQQGTPRWIVAVDGLVVANQRKWTNRTYPLIQHLVARKLERQSSEAQIGLERNVVE
jgi:hypothetical protein